MSAVDTPVITDVTTEDLQAQIAAETLKLGGEPDELRLIAATFRLLTGSAPDTLPEPLRSDVQTEIDRQVAELTRQESELVQLNLKVSPALRTAMRAKALRLRIPLTEALRPLLAAWAAEED